KKNENQVLKEAVITNRDLEKQHKDAIKERDLKIRKIEQENESLNFRNQQLTKKVEGLQEQLRAAESRGSKNAVRGDDHHISDPTLEILQTELRSKIEEIAKLHQKLNDGSEQHVQSVTDLQNRLENLERENSQHQSVLEGLKREHQETVERLQEDKARLEIKVQNQEKVVQSSTLTAAQCSDELTRVQEDLEAKIQWAMGIINNKLPFNDTGLNELNSFNVPTHDRKHQKKTKTLVGQALTMVKELCAGLSNFHTYTEQRCKIYPIDASTGVPISEINQKFCNHLHENAAYLRPIEKAFRSFYNSINDDTLTTLDDRLQALSLVSTVYILDDRMTAYKHYLCLEEECAISSCPQTLESRNMDVHSSFKKMASALVALESYVSLLASASTASSTVLVSNYPGIFKKFAESASHLSSIMHDVSKSYNLKVSLEHQLPTATQKLKTTDECVVSSLISLVTSSGKLAKFLSNNQEFFATPIEFMTRGHSFGSTDNGKGSSPTVTLLRQRAVAYMVGLNRPCPESVPYETAVKEHKVLISSVESKEGLSSQLLETKARVNKLSEEKEHWLLEAQLIQMKLEQEKKKNDEMQDQLMQLMAGQPLPSAVPQEEPPNVPKYQGQKEKKAMGPPTQLGQVTTVSMDSEMSDAIQREQRIKDHYQNILRNEIVKCQDSEGKVVSFNSECRAMQKRLSLAEMLKAKLVQEQKDAQQFIAKLKDDSQVVRRNYAAQLEAMSDHVCEMDKRLAAQKDENDALSSCR
ncbi:hypothetical protein BSL78_04982, partial [Apostichopus japonicus]